MNRFELYNTKSRWKYPTELNNLLIENIANFFKEYNLNRKSNEKILRFKNKPAFVPLKNHLNLLGKFQDKDIPDLRWLVDFFNNKKNNTSLTKSYYETLLSTFNYIYNAENDTFKKRTRINPVEIDSSSQKKRVIISILELTKNKHDKIKELIGNYKYFAAGRKEDTRYDYIYEHDLIIYSNSIIEVINPFNGHTYTGFAHVKSEMCLQIISFDFDNLILDGIGKLLSFKINKYAREAKLMPGLSSSFDSDGRIIFAQALLCSDLLLNKESEIIREYFDKIVPNHRTYSPETKDVAVLVNKYYQ